MLATTPSDSLLTTLILYLPVILIPLGWFWITQFIQLMLMSNNDFPSRSDKWVWGMAFVLVFFLAPFAFWGWKSAFFEGNEA